MGEGYWEPHSSSIDFCESNYLLSPWIVEPHNVWSSFLGITAFGILGLQQSFAAPSNHPLAEHGVRVSFSVLALIGLGSVFLHATLHWTFQSSDELPMIYIVLCFLYGIVEIDSPIRASKRPWLLYLVSGVAIVNSVIYYAFQELYAVFLGTFGVAVTLAIVWMYRLAYHSPNRAARSVGIFQRGTLSYTAVGTPVWIADMLFCDNVLAFANRYAYTMTPHVVWHFCAGFGAYCAIVFIVSCRCECLRAPLTVTNWMGIIPILHPVWPNEKQL